MFQGKWKWNSYNYINAANAAGTEDFLLNEIDYPTNTISQKQKEQKQKMTPWGSYYWKHIKRKHSGSWRETIQDTSIQGFNTYMKIGSGLCSYQIS